MTKPITFKKFTRFNADDAAEGVAHPMTDDAGNYYGSFTTRFMDPDNKALKVLNDKFQREHGKDKEARGKLAGVYSFVNVILTGWTDVLDEDGAQVPFSPANAFQLLGDEEGDSWLFRSLIAASQNAANYAPSLETEKARVAGN